MTPTRRGTLPKAASRVISMITWLAVGGVIFLFAITVLAPRLLGWQTYSVLSSSMEPTIDQGAFVVVQPVQPAQLRVGEVITFALESGKPQTATHRIVGKSIRTSDGAVSFKTKGDANNAPDVAAVLPEQIQGKVRFVIPYLGRFALTGAAASAAVTLTIIGLFGYALLNFWGAWRDRQKEPA